MFKTVLILLMVLNMAVLAQENSTIPQPEGQQETQPASNPLQEEANRLTTHKITDLSGDLILLDNAMIVKMTGLKSSMFNIKPFQKDTLKVGDEVTFVWIPVNLEENSKEEVGKTLNLFIKQGQERYGINVKPIYLGNLQIAAFERNENSPPDSWNGYNMTLSDGTQWNVWALPNLVNTLAPGDSVIFAYVGYPFLTPGNVQIINLSKTDPSEPRFSFAGLAKFTEQSEEK